MGQGFSLTTPSAGSAGIDVPELAELVYEKSISSARFLKSIRARHHDGVVVAKVFVKPYTPMPLEEYKVKIARERKALADIPNALGYQRVVETETNAYLVRQFLYNSLYDRLSTRPFLEDVEKKWLAFQLLCALRDCHARDIHHGDIKAENTLVTSWNWLYLSDFSSAYKPVMLPDDNPADFSYFFDTSGRRTCYLAPERFVAPGEGFDPDAEVTWAMDVFSAGCVIAELFLEAPIFSLSQLYRYRRGEHDPVISHLGRIPDRELREMIAHMIQLDPEKRYSAEHYLDFWRGKVFPDYFYSFLHQYMEVITDPSSGQYPVSGATRNLGEADDRIDRVFLDFDKISYFLGHRSDETPAKAQQVSPRLGLGHFPVRLSIPNNEHYVSGTPHSSSSSSSSSSAAAAADDGTLIFLTLVVSSLRNTARAASKIRACDILLALSERLTDEAKLDRVLPYLVALLSDKADMVVIAAVRSITQLLALVRVVTPVNSHVFLEYVLPRMQAALLINNQGTLSPLIRATYASCLGSLATTASRFLAMAATLRADGTITTADPEVEPGQEAAAAAYDGLFDNAQGELNALFERHTKILIEDSDPFVRRAFLTSVPELCIFFGTAESNDIILTHLNTYLNDRDWMLKCAFFDTIVGIATFLGNITLEEFILPLMIQALTDPEEHVVQAALHALAELANLGLLSRPTIWELADLIGRFMMHPNIWIRESATEFLSAGARYMSPADIWCIGLPLVAPYLKKDLLPAFSELALLDALKKPLSRSVFDQALQWAMKTDRGIFWKSMRKLRTLSFGASGNGGRAGRDTAPQSLGKVARNDEDEAWLSRLRNLGLAAEDEVKLLALREFIWRLSQIKARDSSGQDNTNMQLNSIIPLRTLGITPQTVLFDEEPARPPLAAAPEDSSPRTISDALRDASMTIDDPVGKRRRAALNSRRSRLGSRSRNNMSPASPDGRMPFEDEVPASPTAGQTWSPSDDGQLRSTPGQRGAASADPGASLREGSQSGGKTIRHQSSALSLLNRKDSSKSGPETATTEANAFGQVDGLLVAQGPSARPSLAETDDTDSSIRGARHRANHTYQGNDPSILKMLDAMYADNYPHDIAAFGPTVAPVTRRKASKPGGGGAEEAWKPSGKLVATFTEHTGAINRVAVSPDHVFFVTGGDDGAVKVWDTSRLEKNVSHRSRQTHRHAAGARVLALCFVENTHCFVSCASDGSAHVVKVETAAAGGSARYGRLRLLREYQLPEGESAVWCEHFRQESASVLLLATDRSRVLGIDLRTMTLLYVLENPVHHGTPTCFCVDRRRNWLCLGTSHGVLDLWDLRFRMRLKGWGVPGQSAIYRLCIHPTKGRGKWVCAAGGTGQGEVTVWDLEKTLCREIYRVGGNNNNSNNAKEGPRGYEAWEVDEDKPEGMLGRFATSIEPGAAGSADRGVRAMVAGSGGAGGSSGEEPRDVRHAYILTGGSDKKLRFWDLARIENSAVYSGLTQDEGRPAFSASHPTTALTLHTERFPRQAGAGNGPAGAAGGPLGGGAAPGAGSRAARGGRQPRSTVISKQQHELLRSHLDSVLDMAVLESPYTITVSVDRSGVIHVFQ